MHLVHTADILVCMSLPLRLWGGGVYMFMNNIICHKLAGITFSTNKLLDFYNNQSLQKAFGYSSATLLQYTVE